MASVTTTPPTISPLPRAAGRSNWLRRHAFVAYLARRMGLYLLTLWGAFTVSFFFFHLIPGDPIEAFITSLQQNYVYNVSAGTAVIDHYKQVFGLQGNIFQQYVHYLYQVVVQHDLGPALLDYPTHSQVIIFRALPWTMGLLGLSAVLSWVLGLLIGAVIGWRRNALSSRFLTNVSLAFSHVPYFFVALILIFFFAYRLALFPSQEGYDAGIPPSLSLAFLGSVVHHGLLPAVALVFISTCNWMLSTRQLIISTLGEDYLTFADAKGLTPRRILLNYGLRNAYLPQITAFGISLGFIVNGNVVVEQIFNYPGVGHLLVEALAVLDFDTIQGIVMLSIFAVLTANLLIDLIVPLLDPRVKFAR
jgi:peptide/nickel transport system permease protein